MLADGEPALFAAHPRFENVDFRRLLATNPKTPNGTIPKKAAGLEGVYLSFCDPLRRPLAPAWLFTHWRVRLSIWPQEALATT